MKKEFAQSVKIWLLAGAVLVILMVIIGGITRLTHSGLSMVNWKPITGIVPPLNESEWTAEFEHYKQYPEYQKLNYEFTLNDFKSIFWWEFIHRALGRVIGIIFIVPFLFFLAKKVFDRKWVFRLAVLFLLGGLQGVIGWYMVKSGLVDNPAVSHYRLAVHFIAALTVYSYIIWLLLDLGKVRAVPVHLSIKKWSLALLVLTFIQLIFGTFVAGLKAGLIFNTWPLMAGSFMAPAIQISWSDLGMLSLFDSPATIQFIHRILPFFILIPIVVLWIKAKTGFFKAITRVIAVLWLLQVALGIFTLIYKVPIVLGVLHQLVAVILLTAILFLLHPQFGLTSSSSKH